MDMPKTVLNENISEFRCPLYVCIGDSHYWFEVTLAAVYQRMWGFTYNDVLSLKCPRPQHNSDLLRWRISVSGYCHTVIVFLAHWFLWHLGQYQGLCSSKSSLKLVIRWNIEKHLWKRFNFERVKLNQGVKKQNFLFATFVFIILRLRMTALVGFYLFNSYKCFTINRQTCSMYLANKTIDHVSVTS